MSKNIFIFLIALMIVPTVIGITETTDDYDIFVNDDDWYWSSSSGTQTNTTILHTQHNRVTLPTLTEYSYGDLNTTSIQLNHTITAATLHYYIQSYTASKRTTKVYSIWMMAANETQYILIASNLDFNNPVGWKEYELTAAEYAEIDKEDYTNIRFTITDPGDTKSRYMAIRAREYAPQGDYDMYMTITSESPKIGVCTNEYEGGDFIVNEETACINETVNVDGSFIGNQSLLSLINTNFTTNHSNYNVIVWGTKVTLKSGGIFI